MPNKLKVFRKPPFASEAEEAYWLASPASRRHSEQTFRKAIAAGVIVTNDCKSNSKLRAEAKRTGKVILYKNGLEIKPTGSNPALAVLRELMVRAKAKQMQAVSLRIPISEIEAAKKIGERTGLGYQTVLKEIISKGLRQG
jgi:hypothetical protein